MDPTAPGNIPPGMAASPSLFGTSLMASGMLAPYGLEYTQGEIARQQSSMLFGAQATGFGANFPSYAVTAASSAAMIMSPIMMNAAQSPGIRRAGFALGALDPFNYMQMGFNATRNVGMRMAGATQLANLPAGMTARQVLRSGVVGAAGRGAIGTALAGTATGLVGATGVGALAFAGLEMVAAAGRAVYRGAEETIAGRTSLTELSGSIAPGISTSTVAGQSQSVGRMLSDAGRELGIGLEGAQALTSELRNMRLFQTTNSVKEFKQRFTEVLDAVKEIARTTQSTVEEAVGVFGELRQQGFYTTSDVTAQAARMRARELTTGLSMQEQTAIGQMGAQAARSMGLYGRVGTELFQRSVEGVSMGLRGGTMDEARIMEMGGVEAAGMRIAQRQMQFLSTPRGRALIAATMSGSGFDPDPERLNQILGGNMTTEGIVGMASGRSLRTLMMSGRREAREAMAPFAGMAMVQMAMSQQRQLTGGASREGTVRMLGTMGLGRSEAQVLIDQSINMPQQLRESVAQEEFAMSQGRLTELRRESNIFYRARGALRRGVGLYLGDIGSSVYQSTSRGFRNLNEGIFGGVVFEAGGDEELESARQYLIDRGTAGFGGGGRSEAGALLGPRSGATRFRRSVPSNLQASVGQLRGEGAEFRDLGAGRGIRMSDLASVTRAMESSPVELSQEQRARLENMIAAGDFRSQIRGDERRLTAFGLPGNIQRTTGADTADVRTFAIARRAGLLGDVSFEDFATPGGRISTEERIRTRNMIGSFLQEQEDERDRYFLRPLEHGLGNLGNIEDERAEFRSSLEGFLRETTPSGPLTRLLSLALPGLSMSGGAVGGMRRLLGGIFGGDISNGGDALMERVHRNGRARAAFADFMDVVTDDERDEVALNDVLDRLREHAGDEAFRGVQQILRSTRDAGTRQRLKARWNETSGMRERTGRRDLAERFSRRMGRVSQNLRDYELESRADTPMRAALMNLQDAAAAGAADRFNRGIGRVVGVALDDGTFSNREARDLNEALGGGIGSSLQGIMEGLMATGRNAVERRRNALNMLALNENQRDELMNQLSSADSGARERAALRAITEGRAGALAPGVLEGGKSRTIEGVNAQYVEKNTEFVTAVDKFASRVENLLGVNEPSEPGFFTSIFGSG